MVSFAVQKLVSLIRSHLFIFAFVSFVLEDRSLNIVRIYAKVVVAIISRSFMVPSITFRSLMHFEFIFVYGVRKCSNFFVLHVVA